MNRVAQKGLVTAMVAGGLLAGAGYAQADSAAQGDTTGSPGVLSGNSVEVPVSIPVNVCGNTINVIGLLNPVTGNACANTSAPAATHSSPGARPGRHAGAPADERAVPAGTNSGSGGGAHAAGGTRNSPGLLSGNSIRLPIDVPVNITGNSVNVVGIGNPSTGNTSTNGSTPPVVKPTPVPTAPPAPAHTPVPAPPNVEDPAAPTLAHTGADGLPYTAGGSAALLLGGVVLYRRFRPGRG
ncbi:chaplin [Streptomyces sp. NPDC088910]|uniref:chaplin n=1 Tax=Streptomyces sp. NPDC088910 TaxID=3365911 RepID=UPI003826D96C